MICVYHCSHTNQSGRGESSEKRLQHTSLLIGFQPTNQILLSRSGQLLIIHDVLPLAVCGRLQHWQTSYWPEVNVTDAMLSVWHIHDVLLLVVCGRLQHWQMSYRPEVNVADAIAISMVYQILSLAGQTYFRHVQWAWSSAINFVSAMTCARPFSHCALAPPTSSIARKGSSSID